MTQIYLSYAPKIEFIHEVKMKIYALLDVDPKNGTFETHYFHMNLYFEEEFFDEISSKIKLFLNNVIKDPKKYFMIYATHKVKFEISEEDEPIPALKINPDIKNLNPAKEIKFTTWYDGNTITNPDYFSITEHLKKYLYNLTVKSKFEKHIVITTGYRHSDSSYAGYLY